MIGPIILDHPAVWKMCPVARWRQNLGRPWRILPIPLWTICISKRKNRCSKSDLPKKSTMRVFYVGPIAPWPDWQPKLWLDPIYLKFLIISPTLTRTFKVPLQVEIGILFWRTQTSQRRIPTFMCKFYLDKNLNSELESYQHARCTKNQNLFWINTLYARIQQNPTRFYRFGYSRGHLL